MKKYRKTRSPRAKEQDSATASGAKGFLPTEQTLSVQCPFCFEFIAVNVDFLELEGQALTLDCSVCCRPLVIRTMIGEDDRVIANVEGE